MSDNIVFYIITYVIAIFISSLSQILLKKSSSRHYSSKIKEYLNIFVITAYAIFFVSTILVLFSYKKLTLSTGLALESLSFIFVTIFSRVFFDEKLTPKKILGNIFIILGTIIFAFY